jgi:hypothetical protein
MTMAKFRKGTSGSPFHKEEIHKGRRAGAGMVAHAGPGRAALRTRPEGSGMPQPPAFGKTRGVKTYAGKGEE